MDPKATLEQMITLLRAGDIESSADYAGYLADWLKSGGCSPEIPDHYRNQILRLACDYIILIS